MSDFRGIGTKLASELALPRLSARGCWLGPPVGCSGCKGGVGGGFCRKKRSKSDPLAPARAGVTPAATSDMGAAPPPTANYSTRCLETGSAQRARVFKREDRYKTAGTPERASLYVTSQSGAVAVYNMILSACCENSTAQNHSSSSTAGAAEAEPLQ